MKFAILGAGVTGLTLGRLLREDGHDVSIFESSSQLGGLCRSSEHDGFTFDHVGGHILFSKDKRILDWMLDRVGREQLVQKNRNTRILWHEHRYVPYPFENGVGHLTPEAKFDCLKGYLESVERRKNGEPCPENFYDWIQWKMGSGFAEHFMVPYNEKIWSCDLRRMSSSWVAGRVPDAPIDDILKAAVGIDTQGYTHQAFFWFPLHKGFQALPDGIASSIRDSIRLSSPATSVVRKGEAWRVNDEDFDRVINTVPLPLIQDAIEELPQWLRADIAKLEPISLVNVLFGLKSDKELPDLSWIYLPFVDQGPANRVTFFSNYSPKNAPEGHVSYMAELTFRGQISVDQAFLDGLAQALEGQKLLRRSDLVITQPKITRFAYIDQDLEFNERIARVRKWFDESGIVTVGRFGRYEYHNSDQCIARAFQVHEQMQAFAETGDAKPLRLD